MKQYRKIGITGANGKVGRVLMAGLADEFDIVPFTRREAHRCALEVETDFLIAYAVSNNDKRVFDLESSKEMLGFVPLDNSETYFQGKN